MCALAQRCAPGGACGTGVDGPACPAGNQVFEEPAEAQVLAKGWGTSSLAVNVCPHGLVSWLVGE
eukprot:9186860-Prorocentrum_lima.AAC.1